jgi:hypothetical protein
MKLAPDKTGASFFLPRQAMAFAVFQDDSFKKE